MMAYRDQSPDPVDRIVAWMQRIERRIATVEQRSFTIPVLDDDPDVDDPTNLWLLNDGRMRARDAEDRIREYRPREQQYVPTLATDPGPASGIKLWFKPDGQLRGRLANDTVVKYQPMPIVQTFSANPSASSDITIWLRSDTRNLHVRFPNGDVGQFTNTNANGGGTTSQPNSGDTSDPGSHTSDPKPPRLRTHTHRFTYSSGASKCYCSKHGQENKLYYGQWDATHGERRVMFGLPDATIRSDLSGATIRKVELRVRNLHSYRNSGIEIHWGAHKESALPGAFRQRFRDVWHDHWPKTGFGGGSDNWHTMPDWFGKALRDDKIRGLTIDQPSGSNSFYGLVDESLDIRITFSHKH